MEQRSQNKSVTSKETNSVICLFDAKMRESIRIQRSMSQELTEELSKKIESSFGFTMMQTQLTNASTVSKAFQVVDRLQYVDQFVRLAEIGNSNCIQEMDEMLTKDPKRNMYQRSNPKHLINKRNSKGSNAVYMAAKYGHKAVLIFLHKNQALFNQPSVIKVKYLEQPIEAAARWQHHQTVLWMLDHGQYCQKTLDSVYVKSQSVEIRAKIKDKVSVVAKLKVLLCRCV